MSEAAVHKQRPKRWSKRQIFWHRVLVGGGAACLVAGVAAGAVTTAQAKQRAAEAEAAALARQEAGEGDIVSLSPASASFDRYKNFEARGHHYKELVMAL